jgi:hypothetical protein
MEGNTLQTTRTRMAAMAGVFTAGLLALAGCASPHAASQPASSLHVDSGVSVVKQELTPAQAEAIEPVPVADVTYPQNKNLDEDQIRARFAQIDSDYEVGQQFSAADAEFVEAYATPNAQVFDPSQVAVHTAAGISGGASGGSGTHKASASDKISHTGGPLTWHWSTTVKISTGSAVTKSTIEAHPRGYGIVGQGGVGLVYSANPSTTTTSHSYTWNRSATYTAAEAYFTMYDDVKVYYSGGSFQLG